MFHDYAVGVFERDRGNSECFVCWHPQPVGLALLFKMDQARDIRLAEGKGYLVEIEGGSTTRQNMRQVKRIIAALATIRDVLLAALRERQWVYGYRSSHSHHPSLMITGESITTAYGSFVPHYDTGLRREGHSQGSSIHFVPVQGERRNPYSKALGTRLAQKQLVCTTAQELKRAREAHPSRVLIADSGDLGDRV